MEFTGTVGRQEVHRLRIGSQAASRKLTGNRLEKHPFLLQL
jgi:hypothetical protein